MFHRVCCDEAHKLKSTKTKTYVWVSLLEPSGGFMFLTATPMPNTIEDLKCFLKLNWQEAWYDENHTPNKPWHAIGLFSRVPAPTPDSDESQATPDLVSAPAIKAILNPKLFHRLLNKESGMESEVASNYLPAIMQQISMRRTMSSVIEWTDAITGEAKSVRVGKNVPPYKVKTIELAYKSARNYKRFSKYQSQLSQQLSGPGVTPGPHPESGFVGKRDTAAHKRLQVLATSLHAESFTQSYMRTSHKAGVEEVNTL